MTEETPIIAKPALTVVPFTGSTSCDLPVDDVLVGAREAGLKEVVVLGLEPDDALFMATSSGRLPDIMWLLKLAERLVLEQAYDIE